MNVTRNSLVDLKNAKHLWKEHFSQVIASQPFSACNLLSLTTFVGPLWDTVVKRQQNWYMTEKQHI